MRIMISGAAPLPRHVEEFLRVTTCSVVIQGYGNPSVVLSQQMNDMLISFRNFHVQQVKDQQKVMVIRTHGSYSGLTESCSGCFTSIANVFSMMGTVGVPAATIEARLESVLELGYDALSDVPRGEICLRGNTLFSGYHKRADLLDEVLVDGWFHTGKGSTWPCSSETWS